MGFALRLGKRVRKIRTERGMTQAQLGSIANVGANYVPRLERGEMVPSVENTCRIARALGVSLDDLCGQSGLRKSTSESAGISLNLSSKEAELLEHVLRRLVGKAARAVNGSKKRTRGVKK